MKKPPLMGRLSILKNAQARLAGVGRYVIVAAVDSVASRINYGGVYFNDDVVTRLVDV